VLTDSTEGASFGTRIAEGASAEGTRREESAKGYLVAEGLVSQALVIIIYLNISSKRQKPLICQ